MRQIFSLLIACFALLIISDVFAKNINLYDQPKNDAKVIGTFDSDSGFIPIYTPKDNTAWIKVADPKNGNVGWMKSSDMSTANTSTGFSFRVINTGSGPNGYQMIQFGGPQVNADQAQAFFKKMEVRQQAIQKEMQQWMQDMFSNTNMNWPSFPVFVPVYMQQQQPGVAKTSTQTSTKKIAPTPATTTGNAPGMSPNSGASVGTPSNVNSNAPAAGTSIPASSTTTH